MHLLSQPGMDWECFVTGHTLNDSTGSCDKLLNGLLTETYQRSKFLSHGCISLSG